MDEETGTMGVEGEMVVYMDGEDHKSIVRFEAEDSPSYGKVLGVLREVVKEAVNREFPSILLTFYVSVLRSVHLTVHSLPRTNSRRRRA